MVEIYYQVKCASGLHARPASELVKRASTFCSDIKIKKDFMEANAKSIIDVLSLCAVRGSVVTISASGQDEAAALDEIVSLLDSIED